MFSKEGAGREGICSIVSKVDQLPILRSKISYEFHVSNFSLCALVFFWRGKFSLLFCLFHFTSNYLHLANVDLVERTRNPMKNSIDASDSLIQKQKVGLCASNLHSYISINCLSFSDQKLVMFVSKFLES